MNKYIKSKNLTACKFATETAEVMAFPELQCLYKREFPFNTLCGQVTLFPCLHIRANLPLQMGDRLEGPVSKRSYLFVTCLTSGKRREGLALSLFAMLLL